MTSTKTATTKNTTQQPTNMPTPIVKAKTNKKMGFSRNPFFVRRGEVDLRHPLLMHRVTPDQFLSNLNVPGAFQPDGGAQLKII